MYTEEEIKKYLEILHNYKVEREGVKEILDSNICKGCLNPKSFSEYLGQHICIECGKFHGHILGNIELKDFDRIHYQKRIFIIENIILKKKLKIFLN